MGIERDKGDKEEHYRNIHGDFMEHYHCNYKGIILRQAKKASKQ